MLSKPCYETRINHSMILLVTDSITFSLKDHMPFTYSDTDLFVALE